MQHAEIEDKAKNKKRKLQMKQSKWQQSKWSVQIKLELQTRCRAQTKWKMRGIQPPLSWEGRNATFCAAHERVKWTSRKTTRPAGRGRISSRADSTLPQTKVEDSPATRDGAEYPLQQQSHSNQ